MAKPGGTAEDRDLLAVLKLFAERAGKSILARYIDASSVLEMQEKPDGAPITSADLASEEILVEALSTLTPGVPVVSEDRVTLEGLPGGLPSRYWLVDPLDGTDQFLTQNAEFTVNLALIQDGVPIAGVVHAPALAMTWTGAGPGSAAFSQTDKPAMALNARACPEAGAILFTHRYQGSDLSKTTAEARYRVAKHHRSGSGIVFGFLASGQADIYARLEPSGEWTSAAGHAVLKAAGGSVETEEGEALTYGKPGFRNSGFFAFGRR